MPAPGLKALPRQIARELQHSEDLLQLLEQEQQMLTSMQLETLPELAAAKEQALQALHQATGQRLKTLQHAGVSSLEDLAKRVQMPSALQQRIQRLQANIERAQQLNTQNGLLIHRGMQVNQQLMHLLGGVNTDPSPVYQAREPGTTPGNTLLGEA